LGSGSIGKRPLSKDDSKLERELFPKGLDTETSSNLPVYSTRGRQVKVVFSPGSDDETDPESVPKLNLSMIAAMDEVYFILFCYLNKISKSF